MSGHTPGPWSVHQRPTDPREYGYHVIAEGGLTVCSVSYQLPCNVGGRFGEHTREANARLIAAAPELLEACQTFAEWLRREDEGLPAGIVRGTPEGEQQWRIWWDENLRICALAQEQARAAIAKATGETK